MQKKLKDLKKIIIKAAQNPKFVHYKWFVKYHLEIVEKISMELCDIYKNADKNIVFAMVWLHDYGKILDFANPDETVLKQGKKLLLELNFSKNFVNTVISYIELVDKKLEIDLNKAPLEVKIISSADAAAHLTGPFYLACYIDLGKNMNIHQAMIWNQKKAMQDWERKVVLPEVKRAFRNRHKMRLELCGEMPEKYLV